MSLSVLIKNSVRNNDRSITVAAPVFGQPHGVAPTALPSSSYLGYKLPPSHKAMADKQDEVGDLGGLSALIQNRPLHTLGTGFGRGDNEMVIILCVVFGGGLMVSYIG